jgi:hypothetical protein
MPWLMLVLLPSAGPPDEVSLAVRRGLWRLEKGASAYTTRRECFSCHHQALTVACFAEARRRGLSVSADFLKKQTAFTLDSFRTKHERIRKGQAVPGGNTMAAYALFTLGQVGHEADDTTAALVEYLRVRQKADGAWPALMPRPPSEGSPFANAALALDALSRYGTNKAALAARARGIEWLLSARPKDTEDRTWHLRALVSARAGEERIAEARKALLSLRREAGGWAQLSDLKPDAYATATALMALRAAGMKADDPVFREGSAWLLRRQDASGAWIVKTRSRPVQTYFDNGDPGGKSQFISFLATGWAVRALLELLPERRVP